MKTGMALARAQLSESTSGVVTTQDRKAALVGKGMHREAEKVAKEQPAGTLATKDMPKRKKGSSLDKAQFEEAFSKWMRTSIHAKVRATDSCTKPRPVVCAVLCVRCARCVV